MAETKAVEHGHIPGPEHERRSIRSLVKEAWRLTSQHRVLHCFGVIATTLTLLVGLVYMLFRVQYFFPEAISTLHFLAPDQLWTFFLQHTSLAVTLAVAAGLIYLSYVTVPVWCESALIATIARLHEGQEKHYSFGRAASYGFQSFLPLFEYEALTVVFDITRSFTIILFVWRYFGPTILWQSLPLIFFLFIVVLILSIGMVYSRYNIVLHHGEIFKSIIKSFTLVVFYLGETVLLGVLVLLIGVRTIVNFVLLFALPVGFVALLSYLIQSLSLWLSLLIAGGVGLVIFVFVVRITAALHVFVTAVWTLAFLELSGRKDHRLLEEK